ncbi:MAG: hypothetical protein ACTTJH_01970 [Bacteroidales bacterium]
MEIHSSKVKVQEIMLHKTQAMEDREKKSDCTVLQMQKIIV